MNYADRLKRIEERYGKWLEERNQGPCGIEQLSDKEEKLIGELETVITAYEKLLGK